MDVILKDSACIYTGIKRKNAKRAESNHEAPACPAASAAGPRIRFRLSSTATIPRLSSVAGTSFRLMKLFYQLTKLLSNMKYKSHSIVFIYI